MKSLTSWGKAALAAVFFGAACAGMAATPAFRAASSGGVDLAPQFRSAASAAVQPGISFRAAASAAVSSATSIAVSLPSGTSANDVMIAQISVRPYTTTITPPSGWTLVRRVDYTTLQTSSLAVYRKVAGSSEPSSYTWTLSGNTNAAGGIQAFSGVDTSNPIDVEAGQAVGEGMSFPTASVTTTGANEMIVTAQSFPSSDTWTPPSGMTEAIDVHYGALSGAGQSMEGNYVLQATAGATGAKTATADGASSTYADPGATHILALRPAPSTLSIGLPSGTSTNDVMIAAVSVRPYTASITAPSGWTLVRRVDESSLQTSSLAVFRKVASSSEPASFAFDVSGALDATGGIQSFYNVDTTNPIDVEAGQTTPESLSHATPSVTTTGANEMIVASFAFPTSTTWTPPTGMTEGFDVQYQPVGAGQGESIEGNWAVQVAAGATGAKTATAAGGTGDQDPGTTHILALRPASTNATLTIGVPTGTAANDVMIASIAVRPYTATVGTPAGWTLVRRIDNTVGQTTSLAVFRRVATSSESAPSWSVTGSSYAVGGIQSFSNVDTTNPIDVEAGQATPDGLTHATPTITTTGANEMIVTSHTFATSTTWTPPTGMTEAFDAQIQPVLAAFGQSIEGNYLVQAAAGATGAETATAAGDSSYSDIGATHILALRGLARVAQLYYIETDHLNTPRLIADANQVAVWQWDQAEPFGNNAPNENPSGQGAFTFPLRFPGQYADTETNLTYNYFRDYDSSLGRYVESDPIGLRGGINTYAYVNDGSLAFFDSRGTEVTITCRPLYMLRFLHRPVHCSVFVWHWIVDICGQRTKHIDHQYSLEDGASKPSDPSSPTYRHDTVAFGNPGGANTNYDIPPPPWLTQQQFDQAVQNNGDGYSQGPYSYLPWNYSNSNTAATNIVSGAGGDVPQIPGAWGQAPTSAFGP